MGWVTSRVGLVVSMPTRRSPARGVIDEAVSVLELPWVAVLASTAAMAETSDTCITPVSEPDIEAVTGVDPEVPVDPKPTQISALPLPDWM